MKLNKDLYKIERENSFSRSNRLIAEYKKNHPNASLVSLGIGDVSFPIIPEIAKAMKDACDDLCDMKTFQGYGAYYGIESLRKAISENDYKGLSIGADEIYVGDGTKSDSTSILELFDRESKLLVGNPMYPIYQNGAYALSREPYFAECDEAYKMKVPREHFDIIYICSPCNPIGNAYTKDELRAWIDYANKEDAVIIYDNVYKDFIRSVDVSKSIYEMDGARTCCIELRSYSKNISFSSARCSYMVIPNEFGSEASALWKERTLNRFNGASYIAQVGARESYKKEVLEQVRRNIKVYLDNADYLRNELTDLGFDVIGGIDAPYLWVSTPDNMECWDAFSLFLEKMNVVVVPGSIFGYNGKYRLRISALGTREMCEEAIRRIKKYYEKSI